MISASPVTSVIRSAHRRSSPVHQSTSTSIRMRLSERHCRTSSRHTRQGDIRRTLRPRKIAVLLGTGRRRLLVVRMEVSPFSGPPLIVFSAGKAHHLTFILIRYHLGPGGQPISQHGSQRCHLGAGNYWRVDHCHCQHRRLVSRTSDPS